MNKYWLKVCIFIIFKTILQIIIVKLWYFLKNLLDAWGFSSDELAGEPVEAILNKVVEAGGGWKSIFSCAFSKNRTTKYFFEQW